MSFFTSRIYKLLTKLSTSNALVDQAIVSLGNLATTIILARNLNTEEFGIFSTLLIILFLLQNIQTNAVFAPVYNNYPKVNKSKKRKFYTAIVIYQIITAAILIILAIVLLSILSIIEASISELLGEVIFLIGTTQVQDFFRRYSFAKNQAVLGTLNTLFRYSFQIIGLYFLSDVYNAEFSF